jgi:hypothetical protein
MIMKKFTSFIQTGIWCCLFVGAFSFQVQRLSGDKQRSLDIGYLEGYRDGRDTMKIEFEDQMKAIKHSRKLRKLGFEIQDKGK